MKPRSLQSGFEAIIVIVYLNVGGCFAFPDLLKAGGKRQLCTSKVGPCANEHVLMQ